MPLDALADFHAGRSATLPPGVFNLADTLRFAGPGLTLAGSGPATVLRASGPQQQVILVDRLAQCAIRNLTIDVNADGRKAFLQTRALGIDLNQCVACEVTNVVVQGTIGGPISPGGPVYPGVGIVVGGGERCLVDSCILQRCGHLAPGQTSDGVYASGSHHLIRNCTAAGVTDTAFVLERCNFSSVLNCNAQDCSSGLAITNIGNTNVCGNIASGLHITNWAANTGGICLGTPTADGTGSLLDTTVRDVVLDGTSCGPAVNCRRMGPGLTAGLTLQRISVRGSGAQGLLLAAQKVFIADCELTSCGWNAIQFVPPSAFLVLARNTINPPLGGCALCVESAADGIVVGNALLMANRRPPITFSGACPRWLVDGNLIL